MNSYQLLSSRVLRSALPPLNASRQRMSRTFLKRALVPIMFAQQQSASASAGASAKLTKTKITKNLELYPSADSPADDKHLVIFLSWLMARERHLKKYNTFYNQQGFDVLRIQITPTQLLFPTTGTQVVARDVLDFLLNAQQYKGILVHGFSVGAYLYGECLVQMKRDLRLFQPVADRIIGQIFDSAVDFDGIPTGLPRALTSNRIMQKLLEAYVSTHMKMLYDTATKHYLASSDAFHHNFVHTPSLFYFSKTDPVGTAEGNLRVIRKWELNGFPVFAKCWDSSPHVSHFYHHPDEYMDELKAFLNRLGRLNEPMRRASKL